MWKQRHRARINIPPSTLQTDESTARCFLFMPNLSITLYLTTPLRAVPHLLKHTCTGQRLTTIVWVCGPQLFTWCYRVLSVFWQIRRLQRALLVTYKRKNETVIKDSRMAFLASGERWWDETRWWSAAVSFTRITDVYETASGSKMTKEHKLI